VLTPKQPILLKKVSHSNDINNVEITQYKKNRQITNFFVVGIVVSLLSIFTEEINNTQLLLKKASLLRNHTSNTVKTLVFTIVLYVSVTGTYNSM
jgi:hypothetical protein